MRYKVTLAKAREDGSEETKTVVVEPEFGELAEDAASAAAIDEGLGWLVTSIERGDN